MYLHDTNSLVKNLERSANKYEASAGLNEFSTESPRPTETRVSRECSLAFRRAWHELSFQQIKPSEEATYQVVIVSPSTLKILEFYPLCTHIQDIALSKGVQAYIEPDVETPSGPRTKEEDEFRDAINYFESNKEEFIKKFEGKYVAIINNEAIDSDSNFGKLATRVFKKYRCSKIYIPFVSAKPQVIRISSPHLR